VRIDRRDGGGEDPAYPPQGSDDRSPSGPDERFTAAGTLVGDFDGADLLGVASAYRPTSAAVDDLVESFARRLGVGMPRSKVASLIVAPADADRPG
jgi:hypothetical protein